MKKLLCVLFVLALLPVFSFAESFSKPISAHYTLYMNEESTYGPKGEKVFDYDSLCIDLYMIEGGQECYLHIVSSFSGFVLSNTTNASFITRNGITYLADDNGLFTVVEYDENGEDLWIVYENRTLRLRPVPVFNLYEDFR